MTETTLLCHPTPRERVGAALIAAGFQPHRYVQPDPPRVQGGCVAGWYLGKEETAPVKVYYLPTGTLGQDTTGVQIAMLTLYGDRLREDQGWEWALDRRGIPCLCVQVPESEATQC